MLSPPLALLLMISTPIPRSGNTIEWCFEAVVAVAFLAGPDAMRALQHARAQGVAERERLRTARRKRV
jgi:hypothetical protein